jgi:hypothetical protein
MSMIADMAGVGRNYLPYSKTRMALSTSISELRVGSGTLHEGYEQRESLHERYIHLKQSSKKYCMRILCIFRFKSRIRIHHTE